MTWPKMKSAVLRQWLNPGRILCLTLIVCILPPAAQAQSQSQRKADLSNLVVIGDSVSAGFQNGSMLATLQVNGYASLVAGQAGVDLVLPLIGSPGIPNVITSVSIGPPLVIQRAPGVSPGRTNPSDHPGNLAVPGATVSDALNARPTCDPSNITFTDLVLGLPDPCLGAGLPLSQIETAETRNPTTIFVWLGSEDTLGAAIGGDSSHKAMPNRGKEPISRCPGGRLIVPRPVLQNGLPRSCAAPIDRQSIFTDSDA